MMAVFSRKDVVEVSAVFRAPSSKDMTMKNTVPRIMPRSRVRGAVLIMRRKKRMQRSRKASRKRFARTVKRSMVWSRVLENR